MICALLVAIGVTETGQKPVFGFQAGDKESSTTCREFLKDLKGRGLDYSKMILGVIDGLPSLENSLESCLTYFFVRRKSGFFL